MKPSPDVRVSELRVGEQRYLVVSRPLATRGHGLTEAEWQVARLAAGGASNQEIAAARGTSVRTVANQMARALEKLGVSGRRQLARFLVDSEGGS